VDGESDESIDNGETRDTVDVPIEEESEKKSKGDRKNKSEA
jgi:hypothetical protein